MTMQESELRHQLQNALAAAGLLLEVVVKYDCSDEERARLLDQALVAVKAAQKYLEPLKRKEWNEK